jgi:hypothetical protein
MKLKEQKIEEMTKYQDEFRDRFAEVLIDKDWLQKKTDVSSRGELLLHEEEKVGIEEFWGGD